MLGAHAGCIARACGLSRTRGQEVLGPQPQRHLQRLYFPKPIVCHFLPKETASRVKWELNCDTPEKKVKGLLKVSVHVEVREGLGWGRRPWSDRLESARSRPCVGFALA